VAFIFLNQLGLSYRSFNYKIINKMSTKISKTLAQRVARELIESTLGVQRQTIKEQLRVITANIISKATPQEVKALYLTNKAYFKCATNGRFSFENDSLYAPCYEHPATGEYNPNYKCSESEFKALWALNGELEDLKVKAKKTDTDIVATLCSLSAFKKIKENFPEAYAFIPEEYLSTENASVALPIKSLKEALGLI